MKLLEVASQDHGDLDAFIQSIGKKLKDSGWGVESQPYEVVAKIRGNPEDVLTHMITAVAHLELSGMEPSKLNDGSSVQWEHKKVDGSRAYAGMFFSAAKNRKFMAVVHLYIR